MALLMLYRYSNKYQWRVTNAKRKNAMDNVNVVSYPPPDDKRTQRKREWRESLDAVFGKSL